MKNYNRIYELGKEAKEKFGDKAAHMIAEDLKIDKWDERTLKGCSPFSIDNNPSFSWNPKDNCFKDFSSGRNYGIIDHLMSFYHYSRLGAIRKLCELAGINPDVQVFYDKNKYKKQVLSKDEKPNDRKIVEEYMAKRKISVETLDYCHVKQSERGEVAFQFLDEDGKLISTKYRVSRPCANGQNKWRWQEGITNHDILYGMNWVKCDEPVVICEGPLDCLACVESGWKNVLSIPNGAESDKWIDYNYDFLQNCNDIILWFDNDEAGREGRKKTAERLGEYRIRLVNPDSDIEDKVEEFYLPYGKSIRKTDANNVLVSCGKETVLELITNAQIIENPRIRKIMEFEELQVEDIPHTSTGIVEMDKIFGGVYENSLTIITGVAGDGKSNFINTMYLVSPLENGENVFLYSGELPNRIVLGNILPTFASRRHIVRYQNQDRPDGFMVTKQASKMVHNFYMDKFYVYDEGKDLGTTSLTLFDNMMYAYKRYGCTNFIVDNLLSLDCGKEEGENYMDKEANFVKKLKVFANTYPIKVCIVIHSRKTQVGVKNLGADDIFGSSTHIKVCDRAFSVKRFEEPDKDGNTTEIRCIKDRQKGLKGRYVKLKYDIPSKRLYSTSEERDKRLNWENHMVDVYPDTLQSRLVCNIPEYQDDYCEVF